jgi:hypothetical protein
MSPRECASSRDCPLEVAVQECGDRKVVRRVDHQQRVGEPSSELERLVVQGERSFLVPSFRVDGCEDVERRGRRTRVSRAARDRQRLLAQRLAAHLIASTERDRPEMGQRVVE